MNARLQLENGEIYEGQLFGSKRTVFGELVFTTGMTGYQEALTDPSYRGQILLFTYPLVGNYGITAKSNQSNRIQVEGTVVKEWCRSPQHPHSTENLDEFLKRFSVPGIENIDTRSITEKLRIYGTMKAVLTTEEHASDELFEMLKKEPYPCERNLVAEVSTRNVQNAKCKMQNAKTDTKTVILIDFGVKQSIINNLTKFFDVIIVPWNVTSEQLSSLDFDYVVLSNGPGDPAHSALKPTVTLIKKLMENYPVMGICLGHQLIALACGAKTYKLPFGHRGTNHPVKELNTNRVSITSQNHGYAVEMNSLPEIFEVTYINLNDGTIEGLKHKELPVFSVQFHPEGHPGVYDTEELFEKFEK